MKIEIEITEQDVVHFGFLHDRPVTLDEAQYGLAKTKEKHANKIVELKQFLLSKALDHARMKRTS